MIHTSTVNAGALVVRLRATDATLAALQRKNGRLAAFMGNAIHQAFHAVISDQAAEVLHDTGIQAQPFATSTIFRWRLDIPFRGLVKVGDGAWIRLVGLHPYVLRELETYRRSNPRHLEIDRTPWQVVTATWDNHLYATRFDAAARWVYHAERPAPDALRVRFLTPTTFKSHGQLVAEPTPRLVFGEGLLRRWEAFCPEHPLPADFRAFIETGVSVRRVIAYTRHSVMVKAPFKGFTADVIYDIDPAAPPEHARFLALLADYTALCGVGKKTTMGLGMVDRVRAMPRRSVLESRFS